MTTLEMFYSIPEKEAQIYLGEGEVTQITPQIREIAERIPGKGREFIEGFFSWLEHDGYFKSEPDDNMKELLDTKYLQRTADETFESHYVIGCAEKSIVFASLCRAKGIPAKYVHAAGLDWLQQESDDPMRLHAFVEAFIDGRWVLVNPDPEDPSSMKIYKEINYEQSGYAKWAEGMDFRNLTDNEGKHYSWHSLQELKEDAITFKEHLKETNHLSN